MAVWFKFDNLTYGSGVQRKRIVLVAFRLVPDSKSPWSLSKEEALSVYGKMHELLMLMKTGPFSVTDFLLPEEEFVLLPEHALPPVLNMSGPASVDN